jgi:hypothetical protein
VPWGHHTLLGKKYEILQKLAKPTRSPCSAIWLTSLYLDVIKTKLAQGAENEGQVFEYLVGACPPPAPRFRLVLAELPTTSVQLVQGWRELRVVQQTRGQVLGLGPRETAAEATAALLAGGPGVEEHREFWAGPSHHLVLWLDLSASRIQPADRNAASWGQKRLSGRGCI